MRAIEAKEMCHERLGDRFDSALSDYDTQRRVETLIDLFLPADLTGQTALDVGCGLGFFSQRLHESGADVTACDLGPSLVERTVHRVGCKVGSPPLITAPSTQFARNSRTTSRILSHGNPRCRRAIRAAL